MPRIRELILLMIFIGNHGITRAYDMTSAIDDCLNYGQFVATGDWWGLAKHILTGGRAPEDGIPEVMAKIGKLDEKIDNIANMLNEKMTEVMQTVIKRVPHQVEFDSMIRQLSTYVVRMEMLWRTFQGYQVEGEQFNRDTMQDFIQACVSNIGDSVRNTLGYLVALVAPELTAGFQKSLWTAYLTNVADFPLEERCGKQVTEQYNMFVIHKVIVTLIIRGLHMLVMAYTMQSIYNERSYESEIKQAVAQFILYLERLLTASKVALGPAHREIISCDPPEHIYDVTYTTLDNLFWAVVIKEEHAQMNSECKLGCSDVHFDWYTGRNYDGLRGYFGKPCLGKVNQCQWLGNAGVCLSNSARANYEWIQSGYGDMGDTSSCPSSWTRGISQTLNWFWACNPCICTCTSEYRDAVADRAMSLRPVVSDIDKNEVIMGVAWQKHDGIIFPKILKGQLDGGAQIVNGTENWQDAENFQYEETGSRYGGYNRIVDGEPVKMEEWKDFIFFNGDRRTMYMDDVECEGKSVVTGIKWSCANERCEAFHLEIRCTRFVWSSGDLSTNESETRSAWITPETMKIKSPRYEEKRREIKIEGAGEPSRCKSNPPKSTVNQKIDFDRTDLYADAGQYVVPGLELIPVISAKSPLSGIGAYYKAGDRCGGFLAYKLLGINFAKHISPALTRKQMDHYQRQAG